MKIIYIISLLFLSLKSQANSSNFLKLYFFPTPYSFEWDSPQKLARSVIKNTLLPSKFNYKSSIGHAAVELNCGESFYALTGMTMADSREDTRLILKEKIGLGVMFYPMRGRLQTRQELEVDIKERLGTKSLSWIQYDINEITCHRLRTYLTIYRNENLENVYGLVFNPRKKEGAGCSAFAASFVQIAGILSEEHYMNWSRKLDTNKELNAYNGSASHVSIFKMAAGIGSKQWASSPDQSIPIFFWEPNLMHEWVKKTYQAEKERNIGLYQLEKTGSSIGLRYDARLVIPELGPLFY